MFIKIDRPFYGTLVLNAHYIVEIREATKKLNGKEHAVTTLTMHDGAEHDALDKLSAILKQLAGVHR